MQTKKIDSDMRSSQGSEVEYCEAVVPLSASQIIEMRSLPVSLLSSPGYDSILILDFILFKMIRGEVPFVRGGPIEFRYAHGSRPLIAPVIEPSFVTRPGAGTSHWLLRGITGEVVPNSGVVITNRDAAFAAGTGRAEVHIRCRIVPA